MAKVSYATAAIEARLGNRALSQKLLNDAYELFQETHNLPGIYKCRSGFAELAYLDGDYELALKHSAELLEAARLDMHWPTVLNSLQLIGNALHALGDLDGAEKNYLEAITFARQQFNKLEQIRMETRLANVRAARAALAPDAS